MSLVPGPGRRVRESAAAGATTTNAPATPAAGVGSRDTKGAPSKAGARPATPPAGPGLLCPQCNLVVRRLALRCPRCLAPLPLGCGGACGDCAAGC